MNDNRQPDDIRKRRAHAVKTAWVLGIIAFAIFAVFIGSAVIGR